MFQSAGCRCAARSLTAAAVESSDALFVPFL